MVHPPSVPAQQHVRSPVSVTRPERRQVRLPHPKLSAIPLAAPVVRRRSTDLRQPAGPTHAGLIRIPDLPDQPALPRGRRIARLPRVPADFPHRLPRFHLLQGIRDLFLAEPGLAHLVLLREGPRLAGSKTLGMSRKRGLGQNQEGISVQYRHRAAQGRTGMI